MPEPLDYRPPERRPRRPMGAEETAACILVAGVLFITAFSYVNKPVVKRSGRGVRSPGTSQPVPLPATNRS